MNYRKAIADLEHCWDDGEFLELLRRGRFDQASAEEFLTLLRSIRIRDEDCIPKRLVSLLWFLPSFLQWQEERLIEAGGDVSAFRRFVTQTHEVLESVLGVP